MNIYSVTGPAMLEPSWFNRVRLGRHAAEVCADGCLTVDDVALRLLGERPAAGAAVQVWLNGSGFFVCATVEEIEREAHAQQDAKEAEEEQRRQKLNALRADAEAFNARIALPVRWDSEPVIIDNDVHTLYRLSGSTPPAVH